MSVCGVTIAVYWFADLEITWKVRKWAWTDSAIAWDRDSAVGTVTRPTECRMLDIFCMFLLQQFEVTLMWRASSQICKFNGSCGWELALELIIDYSGGETEQGIDQRGIETVWICQHCRMQRQRWATIVYRAVRGPCETLYVGCMLHYCFRPCLSRSRPLTPQMYSAWVCFVPFSSSALGMPFRQPMHPSLRHDSPPSSSEPNSLPSSATP